MTFAPIVLFCYKRTDVLKQTVKALLKNNEAKESNLFIFSDGYKDENDKKDVENVRKYIRKIKGFKNIEIIEAPTNLGLAASIINGVSKIINEYGKIIVVEDDILTSKYFLKYMNEALDLYENVENCSSITSYGFWINNMPETYFLRRFDCWGWATWKRSWDLFEKDGSKLLNQIKEQGREYEFDCEGTEQFVKMLEDQISGKNNSWAIRMYASQFLHNKLQLHPGISLSRNIGFGKLATHCKYYFKDGRTDVPLLKKPLNLQKIAPKEDPIALKKCLEYFINFKVKDNNSLKYRIFKFLGIKKHNKTYGYIRHDSDFLRQ